MTIYGLKNCPDTDENSIAQKSAILNKMILLNDNIPFIHAPSRELACSLEIPTETLLTGIRQRQLSPTARQRRRNTTQLRDLERESTNFSLGLT